MRWRGAAALTLVLAIAACAWRASSESVPPVGVRRTLEPYVRAAGSAPALAWPRNGQAAVEVQGLGEAVSAGASAPVPIASVAKVMTAYLTLRAHPLSAGERGFTITISPADVTEERERAALGQSLLPVSAGERISERQALQALMLPSANNVAELLAAYDGGVAAFVARMNATASRLGMSSTTYTDPSGFDDDTVSTAADQLRLARVAMRVPAFAAIVAERSARLPLVGRVSNLDGLLGEGGYVGVKTGSDRAAGGCLVFAKHVRVGGARVTVLGVVLGQREGSLIEAALASGRRLGDSAAAAVRVQTLLRAGTRVLSARGADGRRISAVTARPVRTLVWSGRARRVRVAIGPAVTHVRAGQRLASVSVDGPGAASTAAVAVSSLGGPSLGWRLRHLL
jgi:serine-type D-Ala-D-Ala carboxypeptidase (penicillin-binding protein 5/6)